MKFFFLLIFISSPAWAMIEVKINYKAPKDPMSILLESDQKKEGFGQHLGLGDSIENFEIKGEGEFRVLQQTETSISVMNEGPHIDLKKWKHGLSEFEELPQKEKRFTLIKQEPEFPKVDLSEMVSEVVKEGGESWRSVVENCKDINTYPCGVSPSLYRYQFQKKLDGVWKTIMTLNVFPPMGC